MREPVRGKGVGEVGCSQGLCVADAAQSGRDDGRIGQGHEQGFGYGGHRRYGECGEQLRGDVCGQCERPGDRGDNLRLHEVLFERTEDVGDAGIERQALRVGRASG